jgi:hypothetical protein
MNTSRALFIVFGANTESAANDSADVMEAARNILSMMNLRQQRGVGQWFVAEARKLVFAVVKMPAQIQEWMVG